MEMKISGSTIEVLASIITGDATEAPRYRTRRELGNFFSEFGSGNSASALSSRLYYTIDKLEEYNGTDIIHKIIREVLDPVHYNTKSNEEAAKKLSKHLVRDDYRLMSKGKRTDQLSSENSFLTDDSSVVFDVQQIHENTISPSKTIGLNHNSVTDQVNKAKEKLTEGDYDGAITNCYTLVEELLKKLLQETNTSYNQDEGNIKKLYNKLSSQLNLKPEGENLESYLKSILQGLQQQIDGLYQVANKASDRHAKHYNPAQHHAKLAVNATFTLCEFLVDSYNYQKNRTQS